VGVTCSFPSLVTILIAVACTQFDKLNAAIWDIREQHTTPQQGQEEEQIHKNENLQAKLNMCIRHHQEIMA